MPFNEHPPKGCYFIKKLYNAFYQYVQKRKEADGIDID
jgi:hypothetical protein